MKRRLFRALSRFALIFIFCVPFLGHARTAAADAEKDLGLKLVGTANGDDPSKKFTIIKILSTGSQGALREGDRLDEIRIKKIMPGYVVIETRGGEVTLFLGTGEKPGDAAPDPQTVHLDRKEVNSTLPYPAQLMQEIRVRPRFEGGHPGGFLIYGIEPESIFARMGLEDGDVIAGVNGRSFTTTQPTMEFYDGLKKGGTVSLEVSRGESRQQLHFEIR